MDKMPEKLKGTYEAYLWESAVDIRAMIESMMANILNNVDIISANELNSELKTNYVNPKSETSS